MTGTQAGSSFCPPILSTHLVFSEAARDSRAVKCGFAVAIPSPTKTLCRKFYISPGKVKRPGRSDLMISMRESHLLPEKDRTLGKFTLYRSPFGATFGGSYQKMSIGSHLKTFKSTTQILPIINTMALKASMVVNSTTMNEVLVGVNHPGECFVDKLVTVDDGQASDERMHSPGMTKIHSSTAMILVLMRRSSSRVKLTLG